MGSMTPEMLMEDMEVAVETGRCPGCNAPLRFKERKHEVEMWCDACGCMWGFSK